MLGTLVSGSDPKMKAALEALLHVNPAKPGEDEKLADFAGRRDKLEAVAKRIEEGMREIQESMGFTSPDGEVLKSLNWYPEIKPGRKDAFEMAGDDQHRGAAPEVVRGVRVGRLGGLAPQLCRIHGAGQLHRERRAAPEEARHRGRTAEDS